MRAKCYDCGDKTRTKTYTPEWSFMQIKGELVQICPEHTKIRKDTALTRYFGHVNRLSKRKDLSD